MRNTVPIFASPYATGLSWYYFAYFTEACGGGLR